MKRGSGNARADQLLAKWGHAPTATASEHTQPAAARRAEPADRDGDGAARMAAARRDAGEPLTDADRQALRRCPNPTFLCSTCRAYRPRPHTCVPVGDGRERGPCGRCGTAGTGSPCGPCRLAVRSWATETATEQQRRRDAKAGAGEADERDTEGPPLPSVTGRSSGARRSVRASRGRVT